VSNLLYLLAAVVLSVIGCTILWLRRRRPQGLEAGIHEFTRELRALAPDDRDEDRESRSG
jgi:hypothetical protein